MSDSEEEEAPTMADWSRDHSDEDSSSVSETEGADDDREMSATSFVSETEVGEEDDEGDGKKSSRKKKKKAKKKKEKKSKKEKKKTKEKESKSKKKSKKDKKKKKEEEEPPPFQVEMPEQMELPDGDRLAESEDENSEDARMKNLLAAWDNDEMSQDSSDDSSDSDDDEEDAAEKQDIKIELPDNTLDHVVLAAPDFDEAVKEFEGMTGIRPSIVGALRGLGTKSARVGLENNVYVEIIAPDPKNSGPVGAMLSDLEDGILLPFHFAIRGSNLADMKDDYVPNDLGWEPDHISMFGADMDGTPKKWEMLIMYGHNIGGCVPFFIDWGECQHPTATIPEVGGLKSLVIRAPAGHKVHQLLSNVPGIEMQEGEPNIEFAIGSPEGTILFSGDAPSGIRFPGFEEAKEAAEEKEEGGAYQFPGMPELLPTSATNKAENDDSDSDSSDSGEANDDDSKDDDAKPSENEPSEQPESSENADDDSVDVASGDNDEADEEDDGDDDDTSEELENNEALAGEEESYIEEVIATDDEQSYEETVETVSDEE